MNGLESSSSKYFEASSTGTAGAYGRREASVDIRHQRLTFEGAVSHAAYCGHLAVLVERDLPAHAVRQYLGGLAAEPVDLEERRYPDAVDALAALDAAAGVLALSS